MKRTLTSLGIVLGSAIAVQSKALAGRVYRDWNEDVEFAYYWPECIDCVSTDVIGKIYSPKSVGTIYFGRNGIQRFTLGNRSYACFGTLHRSFGSQLATFTLQYTGNVPGLPKCHKIGKVEEFVVQRSREVF